LLSTCWSHLLLLLFSFSTARHFVVLVHLLEVCSMGRGHSSFSMVSPYQVVSWLGGSTLKASGCLSWKVSSSK
jgi:hypothetical protein